MEAVNFMVRLGTAWGVGGRRRRITEDLVMCRAMSIKTRDLTTSETHYHK